MVTVILTVIGLGTGVAAGVWYRRHQRPAWRSVGISVSRWTPVDVAVGLVIPFAAITLVFLVEWGLGAITVVAADFLWPAFLGELGPVVGFAAIEELTFRVGFLSGLVIVFRRFAWGRWVAVVLVAVAFGAVHLHNPGATLATAFGTALGGVIYGVAFVTTRSIWAPLALHVSWNLSQALWGFPVSGNTVWPGWVRSTSVGGELVNGGAYGPEAGIPGMISRAVILALVLIYVKLRWPAGRVATLVFAPDPELRTSRRSRLTHTGTPQVS